ncbi:hypothetical protein C4J81_07340 [Deltaproteobacteria bacterium Smac51]|nr:hypothetical protein C4J81_07340 [Deltaproteobacteria bacterium Smac51]
MSPFEKPLAINIQLASQRLPAMWEDTVQFEAILGTLRKNHAHFKGSFQSVFYSIQKLEKHSSLNILNQTVADKRLPALMRLYNILEHNELAPKLFLDLEWHHDRMTIACALLEAHIQIIKQ